MDPTNFTNNPQPYNVTPANQTAVPNALHAPNGTFPQQNVQPQAAYGMQGNYAVYQESQEQKKKRAAYFRSLALPTLFYAVLYTFFLYKNFSSITMPLFIITTLIYCFYCMKQTNVSTKSGNWFYITVMLLLGVSSAITGSTPIIVMNTIGIILMLLCFLLHNFFSDSNWGFGKYFAAIFTAIFGSIGCIGDPFSDASCYQRENKGSHNSKAIYILIGLGISLPLLFVIIALLSFADLVFADYLHNFTKNINAGSIAGILIMFLFAFFSAYCGVRFLCKRSISEECTDHRRFEPLVAITVLLLVSIIYLFFSMIQILYLFWGKMELPADYTYAQYAREGFFQLLFVCLLNLVIVLFTLGFFRKHTFLNVLLAIISGCTYIMLASSAFRMCLYVRNYHLTFLRFFVFWALGLIALLLAGVLVQIFSDAFPLFRYGLVVVCVCYLALSFCHPDYWIARYNLAQMNSSGEWAQSAYDRENTRAMMDYSYLSGLSSDAAPVIARCEGEWVKDYAERMAEETDDSIRQFNVSHAIARYLFSEEIANLQSSAERTIP